MKMEQNLIKNKQLNITIPVMSKITMKILKITKHGKSVNASEKLHFNSDTETEVSDNDETYHYIKHNTLYYGVL